MRTSTVYLIQGAAIAAIYAAVSLLLMPISYGVMQVRVSEVMTILPCLTPAAIPGLFVGCLVANFMSPFGLPDIIFGSLATLLAALGTYALRKRTWLAPLPPVLANALIVGGMMYYVYGIPLPLWSCMLWVGAGQFLACYCMGLPLLKYLKKREDIFRRRKDA